MANVKTPTKFELRSGFEEEQAEKLGYQTLEDYYSALLTSGAQTAGQYAQAQYQSQATSAAETASYDISKAYANYLKQQRNVLSSANLESGHKEELGSALQEQFESTAAQVKATESQALQTAAKEATKLYTDIYSQSESKANEILSYYQKQASVKANLYKFVEEQAGYDDSKYEFYTKGETGLELTPWGEERIRQALLEEGGDIKGALEAAGMDEELAYYLSNPTEVRKELFGIGEDVYSSTSDTAHKANVSILNTDFYNESAEMAWQKANESGFSGYVSYYKDTFGLTGDEVRQAILSVGVSGLTTNDLNNLSDDDLLRLATGDDLEKYHYELTKLAEKKYGYDYYEQRRPKGMGVASGGAGGASFGGR